MVVLQDLVKPENDSGFKYVRSASAGPNGGGKTTLWKAEINRANEQWRSPYYRYPVDAAKAYCAHVNGATPAPPSVLKTAGHAYNIENTKRDPEVEAALGVLRDARAQRQGKQGYIYLIVEGSSRRPVFGKIGYSVNPDKRVAELQTGNPRVLRVFKKIKGTPTEERALHTKYVTKNVLQEWFFVTPEILQEFKGN